jgi:hypothetical protein
MFSDNARAMSNTDRNLWQMTQRVDEERPNEYSIEAIEKNIDD